MWWIKVFSQFTGWLETDYVKPCSCVFAQQRAETAQTAGTSALKQIPNRLEELCMKCALA